MKKRIYLSHFIFICIQVFILKNIASAKTLEIKSQTLYLGTKSTADYKKWQFKNPLLENIAGISLDQRQTDRPQKEVIVAVIDSGFDIEHQEINPSLWINKKEIPNNGVDDDGNGHIDDIVGWNFIGKSKIYAIFTTSETQSLGINPLSIQDHITFDSYEKVRELKRLMLSRTLSFEDQELFEKISKEIETKKGRAEKLAKQFKSEMDKYEKSALSLGFNDAENLTIEMLTQVRASTPKQILAKEYLLEAIRTKVDFKFFKSQFIQYQLELYYHYNIDLNERELIVGDNKELIKEKGYGNNDVTGFNKKHGTHVAGIISSAAKHIGLEEKIKLMLLKTIPDGDERDKDIVNAIYYAVDNGAQIINMSFGKTISPNSDEVSKALAYAAKRDVLVIKSAGNSYSNLDQENTYPMPYYNGEKLENSLIVAASSADIDETLLASFSNYGSETVDLMAPGVDIYSSLPGNAYGLMSGTSMAAPVVSALAAITKSYFPHLTASEIANALIQYSDNYTGIEVYHSAEGTMPLENFLLNPVIPNFIKIFENFQYQNNLALN